MSNHWGSHMLNEALEALERNGVFEQVGREKTRQVVADYLRIGAMNDGNAYEVLENIGERLGICFGCAQYRSDMVDGLCSECR